MEELTALLTRLYYQTFKAETKKEKYANPLQVRHGGRSRFYPETVGI